MKAVHIQKYGRMPILSTCPIPVRSQGQYLIKMKYAPINPSDLFFYLGLYGVRKEGYPIMGFEGSGVIEQCDDKSLRGRTVSVFANLKNGTYASYIVSTPSEVIIWPKEAQLDQQEISMTMVNPLSVLGMVDLAEKEKIEAVVLSAATSNTSKMLMRILKDKNKNVRVFGMSRSEQYDSQLKKEGFDHVYRMEQTPQLKKQLSHYGKTIFFDCVGGNYAGQVFNVLPPKSTMINYGRLSKENLGSIDLGQLYYRDKRIRGFWLNTYLSECGKDRANYIKNQVIDRSALFKQKIRRVFPLQSFEMGLKESIKNQSEGKILLDLSE